MEDFLHLVHNYTTVSSQPTRTKKWQQRKKQKIVNFKKKLDEYLKTIPDGSRNVPKLAPETNVK